MKAEFMNQKSHSLRVAFSYPLSAISKSSRGLLQSQILAGDTAHKGMLCVAES